MEGIEQSSESAARSHAAAPIEEDQEQLRLFQERLRSEQNLVAGLAAGFVAMVVSAILWAAVTIGTGYQIGYMAIAVGLLVGFSVRYLGKGVDSIFGYSGALLALLGCLLGNALSTIGFVAQAEGLSYFEALSVFNYAAIPELLVATFHPMDLLFYGIAVYEGYKFAFRQVTEQEAAGFSSTDNLELDKR